MATAARLQPVYASVNRPLTIGGADRRLFFVSVVLGGTTFTFFGSLLAGILMFLVLYAAARLVTRRDPQLLRIILRATTMRTHYDPGKLAYLTVRREHA
jgi:type IV secretory pathway TrbD component